jgi:glyoxylase-like metal-dependent hydrolase (beta-lactamase superfamily II)
LLSPDFRQDMTAIRQIERLGYHARDVRHIILTHLDFDHAGGLDDFPHAMVHMLASEAASATAQKTLLDRMRYRPQQWSARGNWQVYTPGSQAERWFGFESVRDLKGLPPELLLVPLTGHTLGHAGVAVDRGREGWLLQAGDAYFYRDEMDLDRPYCTPGLRFYQWMMDKDRTARIRNQDRLRELKRAHGREIFLTNSHDMLAFEVLAQHPSEIAATPA